MMHTLKKILLQSPWHYAVASFLAVMVGLFRFSTLPDAVGVRFACYEIFSVSGFVTFLIGALLTVAYLGAFDLFGYVFSPGRTGAHKRYESYADYSQQMVQKRSRGGYYFVPYYVVGILLVLISYFFG